MSLYPGGLIIGMIFTSEIWGAYFQEGLFIYLSFFFFFGGGGGGGGEGAYYWNFTVYYYRVICSVFHNIIF